MFGGPERAFCPGGSRIWPHAGYWSPNELIRPVKCGAIDERNDVCLVAVTARCDEAAGLTGELCAFYLPGSFRDTARCWRWRCKPRTTGSSVLAAALD